METQIGLIIALAVVWVAFAAVAAISRWNSRRRRKRNEARALEFVAFIKNFKK